MSIQDYRLALKDIVPGYERLVMNCENGGAIQAFSIDDKIVRVGPNATPEQVKEAFIKE